MPRPLLTAVLVLAAAPLATPARAESPLGYYRFPALHGDTIVFTAEGDLWRVGVEGGVARRLTTHAAQETHPAISPDGTTIAFTASYEGPAEVYTMPLDGGLPVRRTWEGGAATVVGWTPKGRILYATRETSTLPDTRLVAIDPGDGTRSPIPLAQASEGAFDAAERSLVFTRLPFQGSFTKRYRGGTAQSLWRYDGPPREATPLTSEFTGTSRTPMPWRGRIYFVSDRDGTMNLWSISDAGSDLKPHTAHRGWDVGGASLSEGRIAYQLGADIRLHDLATGADALVPIRLASDFDQMRERWVNDPMTWTTSAHLAPGGDRVVLTARGQVFVAPAASGRLVRATLRDDVRHRDARFLPDGASILSLSDESGEIEIWRRPANGAGAPERLTDDGSVLRWQAIPSPDGARIAHTDKDLRLWVLDVARKRSTLVAASEVDDIGDLRWSPDGRWLAYVARATNTFQRIWLWSAGTGSVTPITSDRYDSYSPAWSPDGAWLWFLSDRTLESVVDGVWGPRQPEPFMDRPARVYALALTEGLRFPYLPGDELHRPDAKGEPAEGDGKAAPDTCPAKGGDAKEAAGVGTKGAPKVEVRIELDGLPLRLHEAPLAAGNYADLSTDGKRLYLTSAERGIDGKRALMAYAIQEKPEAPETLVEEIRTYELSADGTKILVRKGDALHVVDASGKAPSNLAKTAVDLKGWSFPLRPREEWRQMFKEAWRLERDYFYDRGMHGVDWTAMREKYSPLVDRVTDRAELSDVLGQLVGELSALHIFVRGGDHRDGPDHVDPASLGAALRPDRGAGGWRVERIWRADPDLPGDLSPLARPGVGVREGDVLLAVNGRPALDAPDVRELLRNQAGRQVLLSVLPKDGGAPRDVVVTPMTSAEERELRYDDWEYSRRLRVEELGKGRIGYVHLRAMGTANWSEWARAFYPVFDREGLVVDVRHNRGGNIDSWILEKLLRPAWAYWQPRVGRPSSNMQFAFRGHAVAIADAYTASDGEMFAEGFRRLGLGAVIGTRTWGGEIWLTSSNFLVDRGIATAAEYGVYGPEGAWLIEGHGVDPDVVVDNPPHATFEGGDAQLEAAVRHLLATIEAEPRPFPRPPPYPDKSPAH